MSGDGGTKDGGAELTLLGNLAEEGAEDRAGKLALLGVCLGGESVASASSFSVQVFSEV
jgi:anthranilate/para-aminobenzoate synthase component II